MKTQQSKSMGCNKSISERPVYNFKILPKEMRKISNKQPNVIPKATRKWRIKTSQSYRRKEIIKIIVEINEKEWWKL